MSVGLLVSEEVDFEIHSSNLMYKFNVMYKFN